MRQFRKKAVKDDRKYTPCGKLIYTSNLFKKDAD